MHTHVAYAYAQVKTSLNYTPIHLLYLFTYTSTITADGLIFPNVCTALKSINFVLKLSITYFSVLSDILDSKG